MLRRRLLLFLASFVGLLVAVAIAAIWLLQGVLADLDHTNTTDAQVVEIANQMGASINQIEIELREVQLGRVRHIDTLLRDIDTLHEQTEAFGQQYPRPLPEAAPMYQEIVRWLGDFEENVGKMATVQDSSLGRMHMNATLNASVNLRDRILVIGKVMREHAANEERAAVMRFRWLVLGLAVVFLLLINVSVVMLLRMMGMVLRPVEALVEASRRLGREEFHYRVKLPLGDEFSELGEAYNRLAEQLQLNERRKIETLTQAAVMLNHELNNASAIIKLQLQLLERRSGGNAALERCLREIHASLARMTATIEALKRVRRIVLTDYSADTKMLDLERSVAEDTEHMPTA